MRAWRLVKRRYLDGAFDGEGARRYGGRWNSPGRPVVYLGGTPAVAALEVMVHNARATLLDERFVIVPVDVPDELVLDLDTSVLPPGWHDPTDTAAAAAIGDAWLESAASLALRVPSAVTLLDTNLLLNPAHPDMARAVIGEPRTFRFDARLAG